MTTVEVPETARVDVWGVSYRMHCPRCNLVWDIFVPLDEAVPEYWDICRNCLPALQDALKDETSNKYEYKYTRILVKYPFLNSGLQRIG